MISARPLGVIQGIYLTWFWSDKCLGLSKLVGLGFTQTALNVKLCLMVLLIELYLFIPLSVPLTIFQGHSNVSFI